MIYNDFLNLDIFKENTNILNVQDLKENSFYYGECRNSDLALWKNNKFYYIREKFGIKSVEKINHKDLENNNMHDYFIAFEEVIDIPESIRKYIENNMSIS